MNVPMNDLTIQYAQLKPKMDIALNEVIADCSFILGPQVQNFEAAFAKYNGVKHCIGVSNGTDALKLALRVAAIGAGDEVITTPFTFGATTEVICELGARPVFVDIDPSFFTMNVNQIANRITDKTRAIIPVHIYGQVVDMDPLMALAQKHNLVVIEDAAQAHGARYKQRLSGASGHMGCFSFYPGKNLGAYGDAGGIVTNDDFLADRLRRLRNHGQDPSKKFWYQDLGYNHRMDGFQGAVLNVKLPHLDCWNERRHDLAARYMAGLKHVDGVKVPAEAEYGYHVYHLYVIRAENRDDLSVSLKADGIATAVQYPHPIHLTEAYAFLGYRKGDLPESEKACEEILSLPMFPDLTNEQVDYVIEKVRAFYGK